MCKRGILCGIGGVFFSLAAVCMGAEEMPSASELIDKYTAALDSAMSFIEHHEKNTDFDFSIGGNSNKGRAFEHGQIRYDVQRCYLQSYTWGDFDTRLKNLPKDKPYYHCSVTGDELSYYNGKHIVDVNTPGYAGQHPRRDNKKIDLGAICGIAEITGYINSHKRLDEIFRKSKRVAVREKKENIEGSECFVLEADTIFGNFTVWLDPDHGFLPAKIIGSASKGDFSFTYKLLEGDSAKTYLKNVRFEKVNDIWVLMEADAGFDRRMNNGDFNREDCHYKRTKIIVNPDHDKLGSFADPISENPANDPELTDGTKVRLGRAPTEFIWKGGKLIPVKDPKHKGSKKDSLR